MVGKVRPKREPAVVVDLSPATRAVVSRSGVTFLRGHANFTIDSRELGRLLASLGDEGDG